MKKAEAEEESSEISSERKESLEYARQVNIELGKREGRLVRLDEEIALIEEKLKQASRPKSMQGGDALRIVSLEQYKRQLRVTLKQKSVDRKKVEIEVQKARERKKQIEKELKFIEQD